MFAVISAPIFSWIQIAFSGILCTPSNLLKIPYAIFASCRIIRIPFYLSLEHSSTKQIYHLHHLPSFSFNGHHSGLFLSSVFPQKLSGIALQKPYSVLNRHSSQLSGMSISIIIILLYRPSRISATMLIANAISTNNMAICIIHTSPSVLNSVVLFDNSQPNLVNPTLTFA